MSPSRLEQLEVALRAAAASRRYEEVPLLAAEFGDAVRAYAQTLPQGDPRAAAAGAKLIDLLSWALMMMQAARSTCLSELRRVTTANRYASSHNRPGPPAAVNLDA